ncbi:MAG: LL-diaminopimelate aminotransferase [Chloroflexi bacterium RBG_16_58_14]|nr:MAG: LL-diaminopimelate aminotransferase [Chloroflexi bacterium RBG_16_58_14]
MIKTRAQRLEFSSPLFFASLSEVITTLKAGGYDVIRLDIGSPDMPPAGHILYTLEAAAERGDRHGYQPHQGSPELRQAWADMYRRLYGVMLDPDQEVLPLLGSKEGIFHLPLATIDPGDVVLLPDPGYITYTQGTLFAGGTPYYLPLLAEREYLPELSAIPADVLQRAKILWLNYPHNPTAAVASLDFFTQTVELARRHDLLVCHDAAYGQVSFDGFQPPSLLQVPGASEVGVEFNTLSKSHNMAGWRVGAALGNRQVLRSLYTLKTNADSGHFRPILEAATAAMNGDQGWLEGRNEVYRQRRDLVLQALGQIGLYAAIPKASLYVWFQVPSGWTSLEFANTILEKAHVSLTPGSVFGKYGEGYIRLSFTAPTNRVAEAMQRMVEALS